MWRALWLMSAAFALLVIACDDDKEDSYHTLPSADLREIGEMHFADHGTVDVRGQAELAMEAGAFYFEPTFLRGAPGQRLTLTIRTEDNQNRHSFTLPGQVDRDIPPGGAERIEITFPESGVALFFCKFHQDQGMRGELLVGDAEPQSVP